MLVHWPPGVCEVTQETWRAMEELLATKRVRAIGVSNYLEEHIQEILDDPSLTHAPHINQCELHPQCQWHELRAFCAANGTQFMGYSALPNHLFQTRRKVLECSVDAF